ncbi:MAG: hypothetical protein ACYTGC_00605 [Planctomycetota bacterium]|jgi:hypothetical protein
MNENPQHPPSLTETTSRRHLAGTGPGRGRRSGGQVTRAQQDAARRVGERVQGEFGSLIRSFPLEKRTIAQMSRWLGVTQPVCQRLLRAVRHRDDPLEALTFLPGVRGLHQVVLAARRQGCEEVLLSAAEAAIDQYAGLIDEHGGSQIKLISALQSRSGAPVNGELHETNGDEQLQARMTAFEGIRMLTGREYETQLAVFLYRPDPDDQKHMQIATAMGMIGIRRRAGCLPICPIFTSTPTGDEASVGVQTRTEDLITTLPEFCSTPPPTIVSRRSHGGFPVLIDPDRTSEDPLDLVVASRARRVSNPQHDETKIEDSSLISDGPARNLVMTVFLHRSLAQASIPSCAAFAPGNRGPVGPPVISPDGVSFTNQSTHRWFDRLPGRLHLEHLGIGLEQTHCAVYPRLTELSESLFDAQGWSPQNFVCYRCQVAYPIWGGQYITSFDFGDGESEG